MSKKDYKLIALAFARFHFTNTTGQPDKVKWVAIELMEILKQDNPAFDRDKFLTACGFTE